MTATRIDLNADLGELPPETSVDAAMMAVITSANIACGVHAGDAAIMRRTVRLARDRGVAIGAHPGWPDREGFGRRPVRMDPADVFEAVRAQVAALTAIAAAERVRLGHVKAHGILYTTAARERGVAEALARAVCDADPALALFGPPGSAILAAGAAVGLVPVAEGFADRAYEADGSLTPRSRPGAVIEDPAAVAARAVRIAVDGVVAASGGVEIAIRADTICVHGDTPGAVAMARAVRAALEAAGLTVAPFAGTRTGLS